MQLGVWKSYDELESCLTLEEIFELYQGIIHTRIEDFKNMARANGAKIDDKEEEQDPDAFKKVMEQVRERRGEQPQKEAKNNAIGGVFQIKNI